MSPLLKLRSLSLTLPKTRLEEMLGATLGVENTQAAGKKVIESFLSKKSSPDNETCLSVVVG